MNFTARFNHWTPPGDGPPGGVLVLVPPSNSGGASLLRWKEFSDFAVLHNLAMVACSFKDASPDQIEGYADASAGSGQALIDYLNEVGLGDLPLYLWGFSAGGQFNYEFACWRPDLVGAFVVNKGGFYYHGLAPAATRKLPGLWINGNQDAFSRRVAIIGIYAMNKRDQDCQWRYEAEDASHELGDSVQLGLDFFAEVLGEKEG